MSKELRDKIDQILTEPDISCMDWEIGKSILANWKANVKNQILSLLKSSLISQDKVETIACKLCEYNNKTTCTTPKPDPEHWICKAWLAKAHEIARLFAPELKVLTDETMQDLIDKADCNANVNFIKSDGSLGILGWARKLINVVAQA